MEREHLRPLTGMRFLAALGVVLVHAELIWGILPQLPTSSIAFVMLAHGNLGVDFFFLLSGFILSYSYVETDGSLRGSRRAFWVARIARIYPIYIIGLLIDVVPNLVRQNDVHARILAGITSPLLLQAWVPGISDAVSWNQPGWTLSNEAFFYLLFPFLLPLLSRRAPFTLFRLIVLSWGIFGILPIALYLLGTGGGQRTLSSEWLTAILRNPICSLPEFLIGMAGGLLFIRAKRSMFSYRFSFYGLPTLLVASCLVLFLPGANRYPSAPFIVPFFLLIIVLLAASRGLIAAILSSRLFVELGELSYGIYILHEPIWGWFSLLGITHIFSGWIPSLLYLTTLLVISVLSYHFVERPLRRWIRSLWSRRQERAKDLEILASRSTIR